MVTGNLNIKFETTNLTTAETICSFFQTLIDKAEMNSNLGNNNFNCIPTDGRFFVSGTLWLKNKTYLTKYIDAIKAKWQSSNKTNILNVKATIVRDCHHDEAVNQPCVAETLFEWSSE